jgi:hypothetical protein
MYRITQVLSLGRFATYERAELLRSMGVTHVLNVSDSPSIVSQGFREVAWVPIRDFRRIPDATAEEALESLHRMASEPDAHVYVHCVAGQQRGPTVLWLYLIACGFSEAAAREVIETRSPDAIAGFPWLVDNELVLHVQKMGLRTFLPLTRGEIIIPT